MKNNKNVIIATGGTGGHIYPARAFASFAREMGYNPVIIADERYLRYVNEKGDDKIKYKIIRTGRKLTSIKEIRDICYGFIQTLKFMLEFKPELVIGFGGYASCPTLLSGVILRKKIILHEQNSHIGKVNKLFIRFTKIIATSYREFYGIPYKYMNKIKFTGVPIRKKVLKLKYSEYKFPDFSKKEVFNILIVGGSGGACFFDKNLINSIVKLNKNFSGSIYVTHQCREENIEDVKKIYKSNKIKCDVKSFFSDIEKKIENSHLIITRAGASFIAEVTVAGRPLILVPFPFSTDRHQLKNAESFESRNAAIVVEEKDFDNDKFLELLLKLLKNNQMLVDLAKKSKLKDGEEGVQNLFNVMKEVIGQE